MMMKGGSYTFNVRDQLAWALDLFNNALTPINARIDYTFSEIPFNPQVDNFYVDIGNAYDSHPAYRFSPNDVNHYEFMNQSPSNIARLNLRYNTIMDEQFQQILVNRGHYFDENVTRTQIALYILRINILTSLANTIGFAPPVRNPSLTRYTVVNQSPTGYNLGNTYRLNQLLEGFIQRLGRKIRPGDDYQLSPEVVFAYLHANSNPPAFQNNKSTSDNYPICRPLRHLSFNTGNEITTAGIFGTYAPTWIDLYDRGTKDFCSVTKGGIISCYKNNNGDFNERVLYDDKLSDSGWAYSEAFMKAGYQKDPTDGKSYPVIGFCRLVGNWTHLYCSFYVADKTGHFTKSTAGGDYGYIYTNYHDTPAFAGGNKISNDKWWIDLNGKGMSYCRLTGHMEMACRVFNGIQAGFAKSDIVSQNINDTYGKSYTAGWISNWHGNPAYCRIDGSPSYIYCLPFNRKTMTFGSDVKVAGLQDYYSNDTIKWVDNFTLDGGSALCYLKDDSSGYSMNCLTANSDFTKAVRFPSVSDSGYNSAVGMLSFPGVVGTKGWCGLVGSWTHIQCQLFDNIYTPQGLKNRFVTAESAYVDGGFASVWNGNREWMNYLGQNALYCRNVNAYGNNDDMRCTRIYYK